MQWREVNMLTVFQYATDRQPDTKAVRPKGLDFDWDVIVFTDGTAVAVKSDWSDDSTDYTPDFEALSPDWMLYT